MDTGSEREGRGHVEALLVAPEGGAPMRRVRSVRTRGLQGLEGDRYALGAGHWSEHRSEPVTLIAAEALDEVSRVVGREIAPEAARRNVVTRGVDLDALVGRSFRIGEVTLEGRRPCHPCRYIAALAGVPGLERALRGKGGLRAVLLSEGTLHVGDALGLLATKSIVDSRGETS